MVDGEVRVVDLAINVRHTRLSFVKTSYFDCQRAQVLIIKILQTVPCPIITITL